MFSRKQTEDRGAAGVEQGAMAASSKQVTVIARGVKLEGNFVSEGDVQIEGDVEGHVKTSGALIVGAEAAIVADVAALAATVAGKIQGAVTIQKHLHLKSTAQITGDIQCETIAVDAGASFSGKVSVGANRG